MKFLEHERLSQLTAQLTDAMICERVINGRIEAFSMKRAGSDKKYAHALCEKYQHEIKVEESEFSIFRKMQQRSRSESLTEKDKSLKPNISSPKLSPSNENENTARTPKLMLVNPPSPKPKRVRIDTTRRPRSYSTSAVPLPPSRLMPPTKTPAIRSRSDSYDLKGITSTFPYSNSPLGDFHDTCTQRLMTDLILTLNASFPDYDFSTTRPSHFSKMPSPSVALNRANEKLSELAASLHQGVNFLPQLWSAIDDVIMLCDTEVYSYVPPNLDDDDDPLDFMTQTLDGTESAVPLWGFNFFFVNKSLKRIVLFTCVQTMRTEFDVDDTLEEGFYNTAQEDNFIDLTSGEDSKISTSGLVTRSGSNSFEEGGVDEEDEDGGLDFDMDADCMNQAVTPPHATVA